GDGSPGFRHCLLPSLIGIGLAIARRDLDGEREPLRYVVDPYHGGVAAGTLDGLAESDVVILLPAPALGAELGRSDQLFQRPRNSKRRPGVARMVDRLRRGRHV